MELSTSIQYIKGVGPKRAKDFSKLSVYTVEDLLFLFPNRYEDRRSITPVTAVKIGEKGSVIAEVMAVESTEVRRNMNVIKARLRDENGNFFVAVWFNQRYIKDVLRRGVKGVFYGKVEYKFGELNMVSPEFEVLGASELLDINMGRIVPVYPLAGKLRQKQMRKFLWTVIEECIDQLPEVLPDYLLSKYNLMGRGKAVRSMHFPSSFDELQRARKRLIFEELFLLQVALSIRRKNYRDKHKGYRFLIDESEIKRLLGLLPFELTSAQRRVLNEIFKDLSSGFPMYRLLQGDVGSGKTVVAVLALIVAWHNGYQGAMMAPTEILAEQHYLSVKDMFSHVGMRVAFLGSKLSKGEQEDVCRGLRDGDIDLVIGTHSLIQDRVEFKNLGLVVIDEQHRFGVAQRVKLVSKGRAPHLLVMTATPIPRTLTLTLYGDLDVSIIDQMPPGRKPVKTYWISESSRDRLYEFIRKEVDLGHQIYVVCPIIEESEVLDVQPAVSMYEYLKEDVFPELRVGLLHGDMKSRDKELVMRSFRDGKIDILVATQVIEVGVDVPNATVMVVENAERFGISQLHQLRGRVGRGKHESYCVLISDPKTEEAKKRLRALVEISNGFKLSEIDLKIRGPGEVYGLKQHGMPDLRIADVLRDIDILKIAREEAAALVNYGDKLFDYPSMLSEIKNRWKGRFDLWAGA